MSAYDELKTTKALLFADRRIKELENRIEELEGTLKKAQEVVESWEQRGFVWASEIKSVLGSLREEDNGK